MFYHEQLTVELPFSAALHLLALIRTIKVDTIDLITCWATIQEPFHGPPNGENELIPQDLIQLMHSLFGLFAGSWIQVRVWKKKIEGAAGGTQQVRQNLWREIDGNVSGRGPSCKLPS